MKVKNTIKSKILPEDNSETEEDISGSIVDEESDDSVDEEEDEDVEVSDASSVAGDETDQNAEDVEASGAESDNDAEDLGASATESDDDAEDFEGSGAESDNDAEDLGASGTESDDDVSDEDDEETPTEEPSISKSEMIKRNVLQKYQESHGKQLYIRFPRSISDEEVEQKAKELSPLIIKVHKPRQKYARFCLVDFETKDNRDVTLKALKKLIKKGELEKYQIDIPRTENPDYVKQIAELKVKSLENKKAKARLKRATNKAGKLNSFTSSVLVFNLPKTATIIQVRELFPGAVDVQIKTVKGGVNKDKSIAAITLPSTMEARAAVKNQKLSLGGNQLTVKFDNQKIKKNSTKSQEIKKNQKASTSNIQLESSPSKKHNLDVTEKKQKAKMLQSKTEATATDNSKSVNKKRKLPPTEDVPVKENVKSGNKLPKNKGINKKRKQ